MKINELFENTTVPKGMENFKLYGTYYAPILKDAWSIVDYIASVSDPHLSKHEEDNLLDGIRGTQAVLKLTPITNKLRSMGDASQLEKTNPSYKKIKQYSKMNPKTIPPIVVDNDLVIDGNHRLQAAKELGLKEIWAYIITDADELNESGRLFSGVRLDEIPQKYKHLKVLGRGTTSITLEKDANTVLIFTRDSIKKDWLTQTWGLALAEWIEDYDSRKHPIAGIRQRRIHVLEMPKLFPLNSENKKKANRLVKMVNDAKVYAMNYADHSKRDSYGDKLLTYLERHMEDYEAKQIKLSDDELLKALSTEVDISGNDFYEPHQLRTIVEFLRNYNPNQYGWDLGIRNFMQDANGELIILDPIVDSELLNIYYQQN